MKTETAFTQHTPTSPEKPGLLYLATNKVNGKIYVGQTCLGLPLRKYRHLRDARLGRGSLFHRAIRKYGEDAFEFKVVCVGPQGPWLDEMEIGLIAAYGSFGKAGYNATAGGCGSRGNTNFLGKRHTPETIEKMRQVKLGKVFTDEHRANLARARNKPGYTGGGKGYKHTEEYKRRMAEQNKGQQLSEQARENHRIASAARRGIKPSNETCAKISAAVLSRPIINCPHCDTSGRQGAGMVRYHFDNCKKREGNEDKKFTAHRGPTISCPHCGSEGSSTDMYRWHFDRCKKRGGVDGNLP